jgi:hypothetical protein
MCSSGHMSGPAAAVQEGFPKTELDPAAVGCSCCSLLGELHAASVTMLWQGGEVCVLDGPCVFCCAEANLPSAAAELVHESCCQYL